MGYEVTTNDGSSLIVDGADTYLLEGPLTTFLRTEADRGVVDCWSVRLASVRTADVVRIRRLGDASCELEGSSLMRGSSRLSR